jgi:hypothetical protein
MITLAFRPYDFKIKIEDNVKYIFDIVRRKYVKITPEEWVRQHIVWYLIEELNYPKSLFSLEKKIEVNGLSKRYDLIVYNKLHQPWMLVECKEANIPITENTLAQLLNYQRTIQSPYGLITNGRTTFCCELKMPGFNWLKDLPDYPEN